MCELNDKNRVNFNVNFNEPLKKKCPNYVGLFLDWRLNFRRRFINSFGNIPFAFCIFIPNLLWRMNFDNLKLLLPAQAALGIHVVPLFKLYMCYVVSCTSLLSSEHTYHNIASSDIAHTSNTFDKRRMINVTVDPRNVIARSYHICMLLQICTRVIARNAILFDTTNSLLQISSALCSFVKNMDFGSSSMRCVHSHTTVTSL